MPETVEFNKNDNTSSCRSSRYKVRDASPDSLIFTPSLFSSTSVSVDRCSFASDPPHDDPDYMSMHQHIECSPCSSRDHHQGSAAGCLRPQQDPHPVKLEFQKEYNNSIHNRASTTSVEDDNLVLVDSARSSFSIALKECQDRRSRSEVNANKSERRRPASLDLNNVVGAASSPRLGSVKKNSISSIVRVAGNFPSPGTPNYNNYHHHHHHHRAGVGMQKGWSSERVPLHSNVKGRQFGISGTGSAMVFPFGSNGRALPSKWEDAERWIFSPVSGDGGVVRTRSSTGNAAAVGVGVETQQKRPKSKSGPLGPPGVAYYSLYSPAVPVFDGGSVGNFIAGSPFSAGVLAADGLAIRSNGVHGVRNKPSMARSVSVHGCSEMLGQLSLDEKLNSLKDAGTDISRAVSRRDMATQMSPEGSNHSSPSRRLSFSAATPSALPIVELQSIHSSKPEIRDVEVDERVTVTRWSKKNRNRNDKKNSETLDGWRKKAAEPRSCPWDISEAAKSISKAKREEARINAWENLQKAKAEAAIRKLEVKLDKKRSSSMDKIMNKLKSAQKRAQEMRNSVLSNQAHQVSGTSDKVISLRRTRQTGSLSGCFTCHAF